MTNEESIAQSIREIKEEQVRWDHEINRLREEYRASVAVFSEEDFMQWLTDRIIEKQNARKAEVKRSILPIEETERKRLLREITHLAEVSGIYD